MTEQAGGVEWEAAEALKLMVLGMVRFSEALRNGASAGAAEQLIPMLLELRDVRADRKSDAASAEHNIGMVIDAAEEEQAELGRHAATLGILVAAVKELERRMAAMEAAYLGDSASQSR